MLINMWGLLRTYLRKTAKRRMEIRKRKHTNKKKKFKGDQMVRFYPSDPKLTGKKNISQLAGEGNFLNTFVKASHQFCSLICFQEKKMVTFYNKYTLLQSIR